ncbi:MAG TPA: hypothetical protein VE090_03200 [Methylomirabilota bacterium]|nr:hypothetical protein [Methylomirabilota bacterium]
MAEQKKQAEDLIKWMDDLFKKAPHLPENIREVLVKITPVLSLIFGILGVIAGLAALGLSPIALFGGIHASMFVLVTGVLAIASSVLLLIAYPKLSKYAYAGWMLLFWSEVVNAVSSLLSLSVGSIIGIIIGFYILFEIKGHYK